MSNKFVINPSFQDVREEILEILTHFEFKGEVIYQGRNVIKVFDTSIGKVVVKSFKIPNWVNQFAYSCLRPSKAKRSFEYSLRLDDLQIKTPSPVAFMEERKCGLLKRSFYISLLYDFDYELREVFFNKKPHWKPILASMVDFTWNKLYANNVYHKDYTPGNVLVKEKGGTLEFCIVDINRMEFVSLDKETQLRNISKFSAPDEMAHFMAQEAARINGWDEKATVDDLVSWNKDHRIRVIKRREMKEKLRRRK